MRGHREAHADSTVRAFLQNATRPWHEAVEDAFAPLDLTTRSGLGAFLLAQAGAVLPLEDALDRFGIDEMVPDWADRRRTTALIADLQELGVAEPDSRCAASAPTRHHALGMLYVLEGSRLGGRVLLRRVRQSADDTVHAADRFLGHELPGGWPRFLALLEAAVAGERARADARAGAEAAFALFAASARGRAAGVPDLCIAKPPLVEFAHA